MKIPNVTIQQLLEAGVHLGHKTPDGRFWSEGNVGGAFATGKTQANDGDIVQVAVDMNDKKMWVGINGNWIDSGDPIAGTGENFDSTRGFDYQHYVPFYDSYGSSGLSINFGQNPTFGGKRAAGTNTDDNGRGLFSYDVPTGFLALCEDNLPTPAIADPSKHFKTVLWTGDDTNGKSITGIGFTPDFVWIKARSIAYNHRVFDTVRGPGKDNFLLPNTTAVEGASSDYYGGISSFNNDGFSMVYGTGGNSDGINDSGQNYVAWCWKAGGAAVSNNTGDINANISVNQTAGFSIVSYSGVAASDSSTNSGNPWTIAHGLGKKPDFMIFKCRTASHGWYIYHQSLGATQHVLFNTAAAASGTVLFRDTEPTSEFINVGGWDVINRTGQDYISYCWTEIENYSKFGTFEANGNSDGPFVYLGFKPAFLLCKNIDATESWLMKDSSRQPTNPNEGFLLANSQGAENFSVGNDVDFLSNGFKIRTTNNPNTSGNTYIFAAFAESSFQTANSK